MGRMPAPDKERRGRSSSNAARHRSGAHSRPTVHHSSSCPGDGGARWSSNAATSSRQSVHNSAEGPSALRPCPGDPLSGRWWGLVELERAVRTARQRRAMAGLCGDSAGRRRSWVVVRAHGAPRALGGVLNSRGTQGGAGGGAGAGKSWSMRWIRRRRRVLRAVGALIRSLIPTGCDSMVESILTPDARRICRISLGSTIFTPRQSFFTSMSIAAGYGESAKNATSCRCS